MSNNYFSVMSYVYRHIRLDKNQPFYIGIGKDESYKRAYDKTRRNNFWKNVVAKSDYEVEILMDELTWEQACEKEKEFISLYGRKDLNTGTLVNLTDGGEGGSGMSELTKRIISQKMKNKKCALGTKRTNQFRENASEKMKGKKNALGTIKSDEVKRIQSEKMKGKKCALGCKRSEETKRKISEKIRNYHWEKALDEEFENAKRLGFAE